MWWPGASCADQLACLRNDSTGILESHQKPLLLKVLVSAILSILTDPSAAAGAIRLAPMIGRCAVNEFVRQMSFFKNRLPALSL